jgi:hypothetical protein
MFDFPSIAPPVMIAFVMAEVITSLVSTCQTELRVTGFHHLSASAALEQFREITTDQTLTCLQRVKNRLTMNSEIALANSRLPVQSLRTLS